jgi:hypothetical protein
VTAELMRHAQTRTIAAGVLIFGAGSPRPVVHVLTSGCVKMVRTTPRGEQVPEEIKTFAAQVLPELQQRRTGAQKMYESVKP